MDDCLRADKLADALTKNGKKPFAPWLSHGAKGLTVSRSLMLLLGLVG
ncbi:hypothetical protein J43TS9_61250 [Paenibacillus cineris]|nr:hypothetical protein J43TS9_61250 [Paenibacillus cineris]